MPNGAAYVASPRLYARASASAVRLTDEMPSTRDRKPAPVRRAFTLIVSFVNVFDANWMSPPATPPPFFVE